MTICWLKPSWLQVIFANFVEELTSADSEPFGGLGPVAAAGVERVLDRPAFHLGQERTEWEVLAVLLNGSDCLAD